MTMSLDNLALFADFLYGRLYFHCDFHLSVFLSESVRSILLLFRSGSMAAQRLYSRPGFGILSMVEMQTMHQNRVPLRMRFSWNRGRSFVFSCRRIYDRFPAI